MEFFETKTAPNKGLNSVQKVVVDRIMGGPLTPYFLQLDVQNFTEMRNLKKMQKNRKMVKKSKMPVLEAGSLQNRRFRDFGTLERFLMYICIISKNRRFLGAKIVYWRDYFLFPHTISTPNFAILGFFDFWTPKNLHILCNSRWNF